MTPTPNNLKVEQAHPDFGYVEFQKQEDANSVLDQKFHAIMGKKVSLQLFKTKDEQTKGAPKHHSPFSMTNLHEQEVPSGPPDSRDAAYYPHGSNSLLSADLTFSKFVINTKTEAKPIVQVKANSISKSKTRLAPGRRRMYDEFYASLKSMSEKRDSYHPTCLSSNLRLNRAPPCHTGSGSAR